MRNERKRKKLKTHGKEKTLCRKEERQNLMLLSYSPTLGGLKEEDFKFEASLGFILSLRLAWATKQAPRRRRKDERSTRELTPGRNFKEKKIEQIQVSS